MDNLPGELLPDLAELVSSDRVRFAQVAIVMDVRAGDTMLALAAMRGALEGRGIRPRIVFLEARDEVLIRRYSETRHAHPLGDQHGIASSIAAERSLLEPIRQEADIVIDTSDLSLRELRERLFTQLGTMSDPDQLAIQLISFGFKYGLPLEADLVFDVRFMQNPYYVSDLRQSSGLTEAVKAFVLEQPVAGQFLDFVKGFLEFALPAYVDEGKSRLTIAIGCTGGYHRSIVIAEELAAWLRERDFGPVAVFHRELDRRVNLRRWLTPGIGVKRWLLVIFLGLLVLALAFAHMLRQATRDLAPGGPVGTVIDTLTLQFLPYPVRGLVVAALGLAHRAVRGPQAGTSPDRSVPLRRSQPATGRAHLSEAVPGSRPAHRGDRRRDRAVRLASRPEGTHEQPDRGGHRGGRRWLVGRAPDEPRDPARRGHPQLHRRTRRRRAADERSAPVPLPRPARTGSRRASPAMPSATCSWPR